MSRKHLTKEDKKNIKEIDAWLKKEVWKGRFEAVGEFFKNMFITLSLCCVVFCCYAVHYNKEQVKEVVNSKLELLEKKIKLN